MLRRPRVSHSEEATGTYRGELHGVQLWLAQPDATRHGDPGFEHHAQLPRVELGAGTATVIVGSLGGTASPAAIDSEAVAAELALQPGRSGVPVEGHHEHAVVVLDGRVRLDGRVVEPGVLAYLDWKAEHPRFGRVDSPLAPIPAPDPHWLTGG